MEFSIEEVDNINSRLSNGESIRTISTDLKLNKSTISDLFKKNGYMYDKGINKYILNDVADSTPVRKLVSKPQSKPQNKPILNVPLKIKTKTEMQAFNVVIKKSLVVKLDKIAKEKNYSRTQLVAYLIDWCLEQLK